MSFYFALMLLAVASPAIADSLEAMAYKVISGDMIVVKQGKIKHTIRLAGIRAPAEGQMYHNTSLASLQKLVNKKLLKIDWDKPEEWCKATPNKCPKVGRVIEGALDISLEQVRLGWAWHDIRHLSDQTTPDRTLYAEAEERARAHRYGLWKQKKPIAPWKFKKSEAPPN